MSVVSRRLPTMLCEDNMAIYVHMCPVILFYKLYQAYLKFQINKILE
jgi:hypothetical protein